MPYNFKAPTTRFSRWGFVAIFFVACTLIMGCGQSGPLRLPKEAAQS